MIKRSFSIVNLIYPKLNLQLAHGIAVLTVLHAWALSIDTA